MNQQRPCAIRARTLFTLAGEGPARGRELLAPLGAQDNATLVLAGGKVAETLTATRGLPAGAEVVDLGDVAIAPGCVNAHTHLQLSHLAGRTVLGQGFVPWLGSLVPLLRLPWEPRPMRAACAAMADAGTAHAGDICGSLPNGLTAIADACAASGLGVTHLCEWFGHAPLPSADELPWPSTCRREVAGIGEAACAPACHALYSVAPSTLAAVRTHCRQRGITFSMHLAESPEETLMLAEGRGALRDFLAQRVLPGNFRAPGMRPLGYARQLGLLGPGTLAVHGAQLDEEEIRALGMTGSALCLCPRSNIGIGVGLPRVASLLGSDVLLCLGTDGLSSAPDLDVRREAVLLRDRLDIPAQALLRLLTVNGASALGLSATGLGTLAPGSPARFCVLPRGLVP